MHTISPKHGVKSENRTRVSTATMWCTNHYTNRGRASIILAHQCMLARTHAYLLSIRACRALRCVGQINTSYCFFLTQRWYLVTTKSTNNPRSCGSYGLFYFFFRSTLCVWGPEDALPFPLVLAILFSFAFIVAAAMSSFTPRSSADDTRSRDDGYAQLAAPAAPAGDSDWPGPGSAGAWTASRSVGSCS